MGYEQLASQLLARLPRNILSNRLLDGALNQLESSNIPRPLTASLNFSNLNRTLQPIISLSCPLSRTSKGNLLFSLVSDVAVVWDPLNDACISELSTHSESITGIIELGTDDNAYVTSSHDMTLKYCRLGDNPIVYQDHRLPVNGLQRINDSHFISYSDRDLFLWLHVNNEISIQKRMKLIFKPKDVFVIETKYVLLVPLSGESLLYDLTQDSFKPLCILPFAHLVHPLGTAERCTGLLVSSSDFDLSVIPWPPQPSTILSPVSWPSLHIKDEIITFATASNGDLLALTQDSQLLLWKHSKINEQPLRYPLYGNRLCGFIDVDESCLAVIDKNHRIRLIEITDKTKDYKIKPSSVVSALEFLPNGILITLCGDGSIMAYDIRGSELNLKAVYRSSFITQQSDLTAVAGSHFAASCNDSKVRLWKYNEGNITLSLELEFSSSIELVDGDMPIYLSMLGSSQLYAANTHCLVSWDLDASDIAERIQFKQNNCTEKVSNAKITAVLAAHSDDCRNSILVLSDWDTYYYFSETCVEGELRTHPHFIPQRASTQMADGHIASSASNFNIYMWREGAQSISSCLIGHTSTVRDMIPVHNSLISCSDDYTVRRWTKSRHEYIWQVVFVADSRIISLAHDVNYRLFAAGDVDGNLHIFKI